MQAGVGIDHVLTDAAPPDWAGELEQVTVRGLGFSEVDFFHRASRTLIMTDLVQDFETERMPALSRFLARLNGVAAPNGRAPVYLRLAVRAKWRDAARAAERLVAWGPERGDLQPRALVRPQWNGSAAALAGLAHRRLMPADAVLAPARPAFR